MPKAKMYRAKQRLAIAANKRAARRATFLVKLAGRRNMKVSSHAVNELPCQHGHRQIVSEVAEAGGAHFYKSKACSGCEVGLNYINKVVASPADFPPKTNVKVPKNCYGCTLVQNNWLVSLSPVKPGDVVVAQDPCIVRE